MDDKDIELLLYKVLTPDARQRLNNIRLINEERYLQISKIILSLVQGNKINIPLEDEDLKILLIKTMQNKEINIIRK